VVSLAGGVGGGLFVWLGGFLSVRVIFSVPGGRDVKDVPLVFSAVVSGRVSEGL